MRRPNDPNAAARPAPPDDDDTIAQVRVPVSHVTIGMFVAELDRPWLGSPFLMQGFVVEDDGQLRTLASACRHVDVDPRQSTAEAAGALQALVERGIGQRPDRPGADPSAAEARLEEIAQAQARASGRMHGTSRTGNSKVELIPPRADNRIQPGTRRRFESLVRELDAPPNDDASRAAHGAPALERLSAWLRRVASEIGRSGGAQRASASTGATTAPTVSRAEASRAAIRAELPAGLELTRHRRRRSVAAEMPRAKVALSRSRTVLQQVVSDIGGGRAPDVAKVHAVVDDIVASMIDNPDAMFWVGRLREEDVDAYNHSIKVTIHLIALGRHLGFPAAELSHLGLVGMLADVGKLRLPRAVLDKPGALTPTEFGRVKQHVTLGLEALRAAGPLPAPVELGIAQHHERMDGSGYPSGLSGHEISLYGRMAGIADSFAALTSARAYANALSPQEALLALYEAAGTGLHEALVEQFVQAVGVFPVGSLVEISTGEVAIVVSHNRVRRLEPRVLVLTAADKTPLARPRDLDLLARGRDAGPRLRIVRGLPAGAFGLKAREYYVADAKRAAALPA